MKRFLSLWMFLLCFIGGAFAGVAESPYTYTFSTTEKTFTADGTQTLGGVDWTLAVVWDDATKTDYNKDGKQGMKIGSNSKVPSSMTLVSSAGDIPGTITSVKVKASSRSGAKALLKVKVGEKEFKYNEKTSAEVGSGSLTEYEFTGSASGSVTISMEKNPDGTQHGAFYIGEISVAFQSGSSNLYIIGSVNNWNLANMLPMTLNENTQVFEYVYNTPGGEFLSFSDVASVENWGAFNGIHRYAYGEGNQNAVYGEAQQLVKVTEGNVAFPDQGKYKLSLTKDMKLTVSLLGNYEPPVTPVDNLYIIGSAANDWNLANMPEMKWNETTKAFEYTLKTTGTDYFAFSDVASIANDDWTEFGNHRYAYGAGDQQVLFGTEVQLSKQSDGTLFVNEAGTYLISVTKDLKCTIKAFEDIVLNLTDGDDVGAKVAAAKEGKMVSSIVINLPSGKYTTSSSIVAPKLTINGVDAVIDASAIEDAFITINGSVEFAKKADGTDSDHKLVSEINVTGIKVNGLKGAFIKDAQKSLVEKLTIENSVIEMPAAAKNVLDFNGKGYVGNVVVNNSTIFAKGMNTGFFAQYGSRPKNVNGEWLQQFDVKNSTFVNIANGKNFCDLKQNGTAQNVYTLKNNIFVDCGKNGQTVVGFNKGQTSATPAWDVEGNNFEWGGECKNAAEVEKAGQKDGADIVKNCADGVITFVDAANGDFNGVIDAQLKNTIGDPRWTISVVTGNIASMNVIADKTSFIQNGEVIVVAKEAKTNTKTNVTSNYVYIKDASGSSLIYDNDGSKTAALEVGKTIKAGWKGQVSIYNGLFEVKPTDALAVTDAAAQEIEYPTATSLRVFNAKNVNKIYKITNVTLSDVNGSNFNVKRSTATVAGYNQFDGVQIIEGLVCDEVIAAVGIYNDQVQFQPIKITAKPAEDIVVNMEGGNMSDALAAAREGKNVKSVTFNLSKGDYTASASIVAPALKINAEDAVIDASAIEDAFITINGSVEFAKKADGTDSDHKLVSEINVTGIKVNGLKGAFIKDAQKSLVEKLTIENSVIEMPASNKNVLDFNGKGYVGEVIVNNSTIFAKDKNTGFFAQYGSRPKNVNGEWLQQFNVQKSTFVNIANTKNFCDLKQNGTAQNVYTLKNNIFVDCGKNGQTVVGFNKGQNSATPVWDVDGNNFEWGGECVNAAEIEKASKKAGEDIVKNCVEGVITFADAANGDFNGVLAYTDAKPANAFGDPRWTIEPNCQTIDVAKMNTLADKDEFTFNGDAIVVAKEKKGNKTYVYIKDASGSSLIFDKDGSKTETLEVGKTIQAGWKGQVSIYNGLFEVVPADALAVTDAAAQEIEYPTATSLRVFNAKNVNKIYKITNVTLSDVNGSNFNVKRSTATVAGYNQFDGVLIGEGLVCDEVIAAVGIYNDQVQLQPINITAKPFEPVAVNLNGEGDITEAIAAAKEGKNPSSITVNLGQGKYDVSAPIVTPTGITFIGVGAGGDKGDDDATVIDASKLTGAMVTLNGSIEYAKKSDGSESSFLQYYGAVFNGVKVKGLSDQPLVQAPNTNARAQIIAVDNSVVEVSGSKPIFNLGRLFADDMMVLNSTLYSVDGHTGYLFKSDAQVNNLENGYPNGVRITVDGSTLYKIANGKQMNNSNGHLKGKNFISQTLTNTMLIQSGNAAGNTVKGWQFGQQSNQPTMVYKNNTYWGDIDNADDDLSKYWNGTYEENANQNGIDNSGTIVTGKPFFRKDITEGIFTLGVCPQIGKQVGDPRWYNIPMIVKLQNALLKAAALLDGAQADWQTAPAADEAIEMLAGAYNENVPYLDSNSQEEVDDATLRVEAAIAEFEKVYGSNPTAIKSVDAVKVDGDAWYTINGQRISAPTEKGIYIHNGKKIVVK